MVYELYVKLNDSTIPNKDDLIKLTVKFIWYVMQSPYVNVFKFFDFIYNARYELIELNSIDPTESEIGSVSFINGDPNKLRLTVKLVRWKGVNGIAFNFRTIAHELNHLLYFGLKPKHSVFKFNATDLQISNCHRLLHAVDVYNYDEKFMIGIAEKVGNPQVQYTFMVADPIKIIKYAMT
jgi:hypothetical protein